MSEEIKPGIYKGRGIAGSEQFGKTSNGHDQVVIDLTIDVDGNSRRVSTFLVFTDKSKSFSLDRLRALGWAGGDALVGIDKNEVDVEVRYEEYQGKRQMKIEVMTGGGTFKIKEEMAISERRAFMAGLNADLKNAQVGTKPEEGKGYPASWDKPGPAASSGVKF